MLARLGNHRDPLYFLWARLLYARSRLGSNPDAAEAYVDYSFQFFALGELEQEKRGNRDDGESINIICPSCLDWRETIVSSILCCKGNDGGIGEQPSYLISSHSGGGFPSCDAPPVFSIIHPSVTDFSGAPETPPHLPSPVEAESETLERAMTRDDARF